MVFRSHGKNNGMRYMGRLFHVGGDVAANSRGLARMAREATFAPPSPEANNRKPGGPSG